METGFSLYVGADVAETRKAISCACHNGIERAFTSLQIPEESGDDYREKIQTLLSSCREAGIELIADVSPTILGRLGISSMRELRNMGVSCIRLDFGFSDIETVELSKTFDISLNASTTSLADLEHWRKLGADITRFVACHNFYPKPYTGLALERVKEINRLFTACGVKTVAFIPGDDVLRGPLFDGLPTIEEHRLHREEVARNGLELCVSAKCDAVYVGDPSLSDAGWATLGMLGEGVVPLRVTLDERFEFLYGTLHRDRVDSSPYVFRSVNSRNDDVLMQRLSLLASELEPSICERRKGDIILSLPAYGRYVGELEIARSTMPPILVSR